ncbi:RNA 2',3'-cyclic phosphodiesterase [Thermocrinis sp.]
MVRIFVGFFTTKSIQEQVEKIRQQADDFIKGKWVEPQNYHMTFQFIGDVSEEKVMDIIKCVQEVSQRHKAIKVKYRSLGVFPDVDRARVLWIGVSEGADGLKDLAKDVYHTNRKFGIKSDSKPFHPHVTICRIKEYDKRKLKALLKKYEKASFGEDTVDKISVIRSSLTSVGPIYSVLEEFYLNG